jgi:hypothetical protein
VVAGEAEPGQQRADVGIGPAGHGVPERPGQRFRAEEETARLVDLADVAAGAALTCGDAPQGGDAH